MGAEAALYKSAQKGIAADENQLAVYGYGCEGADAVLVAWVRL